MLLISSWVNNQGRKKHYYLIILFAKVSNIHKRLFLFSHLNFEKQLLRCFGTPRDSKNILQNILNFWWSSKIFDDLLYDTHIFIVKASERFFINKQVRSSENHIRKHTWLSINNIYSVIFAQGNFSKLTLTLRAELQLTSLFKKIRFHILKFPF